MHACTFQAPVSGPLIVGAWSCASKLLALTGRGSSGTIRPSADAREQPGIRLLPPPVSYRTWKERESLRAALRLNGPANLGVQ